MKMKQGSRKSFCMAVCLLTAFALWTVLLRVVDVRAVGPNGTSVGFATINLLVHNLTGVHMVLYVITDWLGLLPIAVCMGFALLGLAQWIQRKSILKVDRSILVLGGFYMAVMAAYVLFEMVVINYRPVLIDGNLEASYPSSTTMLVMCVMPTALMQIRQRMKNGALRRCISAMMIAFVAFMVAGRLVSGVHWVTDIIGGALLSVGLVMMYDAVIRLR